MEKKWIIIKEFIVDIVNIYTLKVIKKWSTAQIVGYVYAK
jgi:hypothetical protein